MNRPRIVLADDHAILLEGLRELLSSDFEIVGAVGDGRALVEAVEALAPDIAVIDISMPLLNGIESARKLRETRPQVKIVFLTMHKDVGLLKEALRAGGFGYVLKESAAQELIAALRQVVGGRYYISPAISDALGAPISEFKRRVTKSPKDDLTLRQIEVLQLIAEGKSMKEIAAVLSISFKTVEFHKYRMMKKLGLKTSAELIRYAVNLGLVALKQ